MIPIWEVWMRRIFLNFFIKALSLGIMSFVIKGHLTDVNGVPVSGYTVRAYDKDPWYDIFGDDPLGSAVTIDDGSFRIEFTKEAFKKPLEIWETDEPQVYLKIYDLSGNFVLETDQLTTPSPQNVSENAQFEVVVIGSGFGGTILSTSLVNKFADEDKALPDDQKRKVCILERGQWWVSHEVPISAGGNELLSKTKPKLGMREYLETNDVPYHLWAYPDNTNGLFELFNILRTVNRRGLYDFRPSDRVHVVTASGVGGGSLVYTNVTEEPDPMVVDAWQSKLGLDINSNNLKPFFDKAKAFIGVNKITTTAANGTFKLARTKAFQEAAERVRLSNPGIVLNSPSGVGDNVEDIYAVNLSITDLPPQKDIATIFKEAGADFNSVLTSIKTNAQFQNKLAEFMRKYAVETNICERQGRCALGCIPGARHTNNKKIFDMLNNDAKKKHIELRVLCQANDIEPREGEEFPYKVYYNDYSIRNLSDNNFSKDGSDGKKYRVDTKLFEWLDEGQEKFVFAKKVILAAGAVGSTELLLKSANSTRRTMDKNLKFSDKLGERFSTNGDLLGVVKPTKLDIALTRGPIVTSAIRFREDADTIYTIEDSGLPKMFAGISPFLSNPDLMRRLMGLVSLGYVQQLITMLNQNSAIAVTNPNVPLSVTEQDLSHVMLLSGMGTDSADGSIKLKDSWTLSDANAINVSIDLNKQKPLFDKMKAKMAGIAEHMGELGSISLSTPFWDSNDVAGSSTIVLHPLGGCAIGSDRKQGVVNSMGQVFDGRGNDDSALYDGLYVVDGGIVPSALGVNSSLTISALAFRIAQNLVGTQYLPVEEVVINGETHYLPK
jgi:choline dehydrogenase-like flavoprotein